MPSIDRVVGVVHPDVDRVEEHAVEAVARVRAPSICAARSLAPGRVPGIQPGLPAGVVRAREVPVRLVAVEAVARRALEKRRGVELAEARQPRVHAVAAEHRHQVHAERARPVAERREARLAAQLRLGPIVAVLPVVAALPAREVGEHAPSLDALRHEAQHAQHAGVVEEAPPRPVHAVQRHHEAQLARPGRHVARARRRAAGRRRAVRTRAGPRASPASRRRARARRAAPRARGRSGSHPPRGSARARPAPRARPVRSTATAKRFSRTRRSSKRAASGSPPLRSSSSGSGRRFG